MSGVGLKIPVAAAAAAGSSDLLAQTVGGVKTFSNPIVLPSGFMFPVSTLTVSSNAVTRTGAYHQISTGSGAVTVNTINGGSHGDILILRTTSSSNAATINSNVGNIELANGTCVLDTSGKTITLIYSGSAWIEISRSNTPGLVSAFSEWQAYSATFLTGNGTGYVLQQEFYARIGKTIFYMFFIQGLSSGTRSADVLGVSVPVTARSASSFRCVGSFDFVGSGTGTAGTGTVFMSADGTTMNFYHAPTPGSSDPDPVVGTQISGNSSKILANGFYEAAS